MPDYTQLSSREIERLAYSIQPGEWHCESERPIATLLGSCVAVCLYDSALPIAGMNHFMLPQMSKVYANSEDILLAGDACMAALLNGLLARGAARHRIKAKAFGGGAVIDTRGPAVSIGQKNTDFTREWLAREHIPLVASDFMGPWARKVLCVPQNGDVYCKRITVNAVNAADLRKAEQDYAATLVRKEFTPTGEKRIELF